MKIMATLTGNNLKKANSMLYNITTLFDQHNIIYHLEGGTLLGIVRDQRLLPWDHDLDLSIPSTQIDKIINIKDILSKKHRVKIHLFSDDKYIIKRNSLRIIKIKNKLTSFLKNLSPFLFRRYDIVLDVFVKYSDDEYTYWEASEKIMRVSSKYYSSYEEIAYNNKIYKVPNHYKEYLIEKYGNWQTPVKEWNCSVDEKTIIK